MGAVLAEVVLPSMTGILADSVVNTFVFQTAGDVPTSTELDNIDTALAAFYNTAQTSGSTVANIIGPQISRAANAAHIKLYDIFSHLDGSPHGSPIRDSTFTLGATQGGATELPSEVSVVLSFHSVLTNVPQEGAGGIRPASRRRGRIYVGPVDSLALFADATTHIVTVATVCMNTLTQAGAALIADAGTNWSQWSRKDNAVATVTGGFCDNAFDTQRRRGEKASIRTSFGGA